MWKKEENNMAHPMNHLRDHKVQRSRVADITKACGGGMASGGAADAVSKQQTLIGSLAKKNIMRATGGKVTARSDRPARAFGGRLKKGGGKKKSGHTVNVIVGGQHPPAPTMPMHPPMIPGVAAGAPPGAPPPMPPRPPMGAAPPPPGPMGGPPGVPGMPPGVPPPGMPRKRGGKVSAMSMSSEDSSNAGIGKGRTGIQKSYPSNKSDTQNIGRDAVVTKATGGPIYSKAKGQMGPKFIGGSMGGVAKLQKMRRAEKSGYGGATRKAMNPTRDPRG
jgi:hypothetical protein